MGDAHREAEGLREDVGNLTRQVGDGASRLAAQAAQLQQLAGVERDLAQAQQQLQALQSTNQV